MLVLCHLAAARKQKQPGLQDSCNKVELHMFAYLVRSFAVIVLIHVICDGVDVERRNYFNVWAALLQREVHPCRYSLLKPVL